MARLRGARPLPPARRDALAPGCAARALPGRVGTALCPSLVDRPPGQRRAGDPGARRTRAERLVAPGRPGHGRRGDRRPPRVVGEGPDVLACADPAAQDAGRGVGRPPGHRARRRRRGRRSGPRRRAGGAPRSGPGGRRAVDHRPLREPARGRLRPHGRNPPPRGGPDRRRRDRLVRQDLDQEPHRPSRWRGPPGGAHPGVVQQPGRAGARHQREPGAGHGGLRGGDGHLRAGRDRRALSVVRAGRIGHHGDRPRPSRAVRLPRAHRRGEVRDRRRRTGRRAQRRRRDAGVPGRAARGIGHPSGARGIGEPLGRGPRLEGRGAPASLGRWGRARRGGRGGAGGPCHQSRLRGGRGAGARGRVRAAVGQAGQPAGRAQPAHRGEGALGGAGPRRHLQRQPGRHEGGTGRPRGPRRSRSPSGGHARHGGARRSPGGGERALRGRAPPRSPPIW